MIGELFTINTTNNVFQAKEDLHYKTPGLLVAAYATAVVLGVEIMQINAWLPDPIWAQR